jgi:hypothetical protein
MNIICLPLIIKSSFTITPFEAVYCDHQTYQHIKMQESVIEDNLEDVYLVHTRNFILNEVEADIVYLQNKSIGKNHNNWVSGYRYKAWYKAYDKVVFGSAVTPKTDVGPYIIESSGEITAYACNGVHITPGFHAQNGSKFHAYTHCDGCSRPRQKSDVETPEQQDNNTRSANQFGLENEKQAIELKLFPNPNSGDFKIVFPSSPGQFSISDLNGRVFKQELILEENKTMYLTLPKGLYFIKWTDNKDIVTKKIIVI